MTLQQIASIVGGTIEGDKDALIHAYGKIEEGASGEITFFANPRYEPYIYTTNSSALILPNDYRLIKPITPSVIRVDNVYEAISKLMEVYAQPLLHSQGISPQSSISPSAIIGKNVSIGAFCIIGDNVVIEDEVVLYGQNYIGQNSVIGRQTKIHPGAKIYHYVKIGQRCTIQANVVLGSDGFGFSRDGEGRFKKIPQNGGILIGNDVEIGANCTIDRASVGNTIIENGVKLDNLIQIGHNVEVGENTAIAAQTGIAGSTTIGKNCLIGGQVGFVGHIHVADGTMIQAKSGIASDIKESNKKFYGYPAIAYQDYLKSYAYFRRFPDIIDKIRQLEKELDLLKQKQS